MSRIRSTNPLTDDVRTADRIRVLQRYRLAIRVGDWWAGRRDGRRGLPEREENTQWMRRLAAQNREGCQAVRRAVDRNSASAVARLQGLIAELANVEEHLAELTERLDTLPEEPSAEELAVRGPAEAHASEAVLATRARRRHATILAAARSNRDAVLARRRALLVDVELVRAELDMLHALGRTQAFRVVEHHRRRLHVYLRALVRQHAERSRVVDLYDRHPVDPPEWATATSPWTTEPTPPTITGSGRWLELA
ncbi:hypothetical protein [Pseudonocardia xishanensis]|uniref:Uncharacterized protein n=1 Tax=Pseudonocardia xishanensis TaxID=630995 RepID=A0ABP8RCE3_9PSEU